MATISEALAIAIQHHQSGRLEPAEQIYRQILQAEPNHADAIHLLGVIASQMGKYEIAVEYIERAIELNGNELVFHNNLGEAYRDLGRIPEAVACYRRVLELKPDCTEAHNNLGKVLQQLGKLEEAIASWRQALGSKPDDAEAHYLLGNALQQQGKLTEAMANWRQAVRFNPDNAAAYNNLGIALQQQGKLEEAVASLQQALRLRPDFIQAHHNMANALLAQGKLEEAIAGYQHVVRSRPDSAAAYINLGKAFLDQGRLDEAVASLRQALQIDPDYADAYNNLGLIRNSQGQTEEAVACFRRALQLKPESVDAYNHLGNVFKKRGNLEQAVACYQQALHFNPDDVQAHLNLGAAFHDQGKFEEAVARYHHALRLKPDYAEAHYNLGMAWLLLGNFEQGWLECEWRKSKELILQSFSQPLWDGSPLAGRTILLHSEQGLGDTLQFIRYASEIKKGGGRVALSCPLSLVGLLSSCPDIDRFLPQTSPLPEFDVQAPLLSLPGILKTSLATMPASVPYLFADPKLIDHWRQKLSEPSALKIGIAWQGNPDYFLDRQRSIPLAHLAPIARLEGVKLFSLQKGPGTEQISAVRDEIAVTDLGSQLDQSGAKFVDTAAVMKNLDLVITSDSAVAHLAGALGVPVWVAIPFVPDWRWLLHREDSPWYPTMRLFRQPEMGNWQAVFERITVELLKNSWKDQTRIPEIR